jgi:hypothetical protein
MKTKTAKAIVEIYHETDNEFEEKSIAFILEVVAERCRERGIIHDCDCGHVTDALVQEGVYK